MAVDVDVSQLVSYLDLKTEKDVKNFVLSTMHWATFAETYFRDPDDPESPLRLEIGQKKAINSLQFGYDIDSVPKDYEVKNPPKIVVMVWPRQCTVAGTLVQLSDGILKPIEEIRNHESVLNYNKKLKPSNGTDFKDNGVKPCLRITTSNGRQIECTHNHPFLTSEEGIKKPKYIKAIDLSINDKVAMARKLPEMGTKILSDDEIKFIAYMITEGCLTGNTPYFTNKTHEIVRDWKRIVKDWHQQKSNGDLRCMYNCKNKKLQQLLKDVSLDGKRSGNKFIPEVIFKSTTRQIAIFLSKMIDCDGNIYKGNRKCAEIHYTSKSKRLIDDLALLFTRIGMYGNIYNYKTNNKTYWRIKFTSSEDIKNAKKYLKLTTYKQILDSSKETGLSTSDVFPYYHLIKEAKEKNNWTCKYIYEKTGYTFETNRIKSLTHNSIDKLSSIIEIDKNIYWDKIVSIEDVGEQQTYGITVYPHHNHITNGFITENTGKTTAVAIAVAVILCLQPGVKIGVMGMSEPSSKNLIDRIKLFLRNSPFKDEIERNLKMEIVMKSGGYVMAHTTSEGIRGQSYHYLLLDEAAQIEDDIIEGAALDTTRKIGKRVVLLSTPKGYQGLLVKYYLQGLRTRKVVCKNCYEVYDQAYFQRAQWDAVTMSPGLPACEECDYYEEDEVYNRAPPSASQRVRDKLVVTEGKTYFFEPGDYTIISIDPFNCSFYPPEEILSELDRRGWTDLAKQELLGEIIPEGQSVFRKEWLDACTDDTLQNVMKYDQNKSYVMGVDFGKIHDDSVIAVGHEEKGIAILDYLRIIPSDVKGKEYEDIKTDVVEVAMFYKPIWIVPDSTGMGEPIVEVMENDLYARGWRGRIYNNKNNRMGFIFDVKTKPDLIENLVEYFARNRIRIPPEYEVHVDVLRNQLLNFSYEATRSNYIKYGVQLEHDDAVIALALMIWGHRHKPWIQLSASFDMPRGNL